MGNCLSDKMNESTATTTTTSTSTTPPKKVVVIGASFGGQGFVHGLMMKKGNDNTNESVLDPDASKHFSVELLDSQKDFCLGAAFQYLWTNRVTDKKSITYSMSQMKSATFPGVSWKNERTVTSIDKESKTVSLTDGSILSYDVLVLAAGVKSNPKLIPGLSESGAIDVCSWDHVDQLQSEIQSIISMAKSSSTSQQLLDVVVSITKSPYKCPPLPFEVVSLIDNELRSAGVRDSCQVYLTVPQAFPFGGPPAKKTFMNQLKEMGIEYLEQHQIVSIEPKKQQNDKPQLSSSCLIHCEVEGETKSLNADAFFCTYPQQPPSFLMDSDLPKHKLGFVLVDLQTNKVDGIDDMYAVGDCCWTSFPAVGKPHPKAGQFAYDMGVAVGTHVKNKHMSPDTPPYIPTSRTGICAAECGIDGKGVIVKPDFSDCIQNPDSGKPKFNLENVTNASERKLQWINGFLETFFGKGNVAPMQ